ncbi:MAG TPA: hypothetical protein VGM98_22095 [Schlesneria sp.]
MVQWALAPSLLTTWERAYGLSPVQRGLALLSLARPRDAVEQLANWTIGERDASLLDFRSSLFGTGIESVAACPECSEKLEVSFQVGDIRLVDAPAPKAQTLRIDSHSAILRPLTSADLLAVERQPSARLRREVLLSRCVTIPDAGPISESDSAELKSTNWSDEAQRAIADLLAEIDPQADIRISLDCSRCNHAWSSRFDITTHLWSEVDVWAQRMLAEVHALAFAYGWSERDILAMTPWRRQLYMGMLRR